MDTPQPTAAPPQEDLSNKTIVLLVILTLAVSFIGAWVNINTAMTATAQPTASTSDAQVNFEIAGPQPPKTTSANGMVTLEITQ